MASWIIKHFPQHVCYVEPFGGAMSVLLKKHPSSLEVYNDRDYEVVNFFRVLREQLEELKRVIAATPFSREELRKAFDATEDDLERARKLYIRAWQGRGGPRAGWRPGWRFQRTMNRGKTVVSDWTDISHLMGIADRLRQVQLDCDTAEKVIARFDSPDTLLYCDPPYPRETRSPRWGVRAYVHEMSNEDHRALAAQLHDIEGMAIISSYPGELYRELYADWESVSKSTQTDANTTKTEVLWLSPNTQARRRPLFTQGDWDE